MAKVEISKRLVAINSASTIAMRILSISVIVWLQQYLLRRVPAEEYSLLPVLGAVMIFAPLVSTVLTSGIARYVTEAYAKGDELRVTQITSTMFPILLAVGLAFLAAGGVFAWYVDHVLTIDPAFVWDARLMMMLMMFAFALRLPLAPFQVGLYVRQKFVLQNGIEFCAQLLSLALMFALLFGVSTRVIWVVVATTAMHVSDVVARAAVSRRLIPSLRWDRRAFCPALVKPLTAFGAWNLLGHLSTMIRQAADPLILNKLATPVDVATFHVGSLADRQMQGFMMDAFGPVQPALIAMHAEGEKERLQYTYMRIGRFAVWLIMIGAVPLMVFSRDLFQLYLRERYSLYARAGTVMVLLLACYPLLYATSGVGRIAVATARIRPYMLLSFGGQLANLALTLYLVGALGMGAVGSALATLVTGAAACIFGLVPLGLHMLNLRFSRFFWQTLWPGLLPAVCGCGAWMGLRVLVRPSSWLQLGMCFCGGMVVYVVVLLVFCLQTADRNDLRRVWERVRSVTPKSPC